MADGPHEDVTSTLSELERKLIELERELLSVAGGAATEPVLPPTPAIDPAAEAATPPPPEAIRSLRVELDELVIVRDRLRVIADELVERCDRLVDRLGAPDEVGAEAEAADGAPPSGGAADR